MPAPFRLLSTACFLYVYIGTDGMVAAYDMERDVSLLHLVKIYIGANGEYGFFWISKIQG